MNMSPRTEDEITASQWIAYLEDTAEKVRMALDETTPRHRFALMALVDDIDKATERLRTGAVLH
jgi:hypothetical protein